MADRGLDVTLRIRADLAGVQAELERVRSGVRAIGSAGREATQGLRGVDASPLRDAGAAAGEASDRIRAMVQASLEAQAAANAQAAAQQQSADAARSIAQVSDEQAAAIQRANAAAFESQAAVSAQIAAISELDERVTRGASSLSELADTEARLDAAFAQGLVTVEEHNAAIAELDKSEASLRRELDQQRASVERILARYDVASVALKRLARDEDELRRARERGLITQRELEVGLAGIATRRAGIEQLNAAVDGTAQGLRRAAGNASLATQQLLTAGRAALTGNFQQAASSLSVLAVRSGSLAPLLGRLGLALGATGSLALLFGARMLSAARDSDELSRAVIATGGAAGQTGPELESLARSVGRQAGGFSRARDAALGLAGAAGLSTRALRDAAVASVALAELTGQGVDQVVQRIAGLGREPTRVVQELDRQYNFLTTSVLAQIQALERQGQVQEAADLAARTAADAFSRRAADVRAELNTLDRFLLDTAEGFRRMWDAAADPFRARTAVDNLVAVQTSIAELRAELRRRDRDEGALGFFVGRSQAGADRALEQALAKRARLLDAARSEQAEADERAQRRAIEDAGKSALVALSGELDQARGRTEQMELALQRVAEQFGALRAAGQTALEGLPLDDAQARIEASIRQRFAERPTRARRTGPDPEAEAARLNEQLVRQVALLGSSTEAARVNFELTRGSLRDVSDATRQRLIDNAQLLDSERARLATEREIAQLTPQLLRDTGRAAEAAALEIEQSFGDLRRRLEIFGTADQRGLLEQAIGARQAREQLTGLERQLDSTLQAAARRQQAVTAQQQAGLITEAEARRQVLAITRDQVAAVDAMLPQMQALAMTLGDPAALDRVRQIRAELALTQIAASELQTAFTGAFEGALTRAIDGLIERTGSLLDLARAFVIEIARGVSQFASAQLAQRATVGLTNLLSGGGDAAAEAAGSAAGAAAIGTAITTASGTGAAAMGAAVSAGSATGATAMGGAVAGAGTVAATAMGSAITAAGAAAAAQMAAAIAAANAVPSIPIPGFASGGFTGDGGKYTPAGIVHAGEYVIRREMVSRYGAGLFEALNQGRFPGPSVHVRPAPRASFADGGLAGGLPAPQVNNRFRFINVIDAEDIGRRFAASPSFEKAVINVIGANPRAIKTELA